MANKCIELVSREQGFTRIEQQQRQPTRVEHEFDPRALGAFQHRLHAIR